MYMVNEQGQAADLLDSQVATLHNLLFTFGHRAMTESYFTLYTFSDGTRQIQECKFASYAFDPEQGEDAALVMQSGQGIEAYAQELFASLGKRKVTGFAMCAGLPTPQGGFEYWSLSTDDRLFSQANRFIPFYNEDGIEDYMCLTCDHERDIDTIEHMIMATSDVWKLANRVGAATLNVDMTRLMEIA